jgi:leucyl/phenylalanyl-tRNA--protein transferase
LLGYTLGIFPWYSEGQPILWHSPDPRFVLLADEFRVPRSLRKTIRRSPYVLTMDQAFTEVIEACATADRPEQQGTWITGDMAKSYAELHRLGFAHSVEAWADGILVGGLYGVTVGQVFFGESMFARAPDASKVAFVALFRQLERWGHDMLDSQVYTEHLARFGAREIPRDDYLERLRERVRDPRPRRVWAFDEACLEELRDDPGSSQRRP